MVLEFIGGGGGGDDGGGNVHVVSQRVVLW